MSISRSGSSSRFIQFKFLLLFKRLPIPKNSTLRLKQLHQEPAGPDSQLATSDSAFPLGNNI